MDYLYLHGLASSPQSTKAQFLNQQFASLGKTLHILDLNQANFGHLTLTRQIHQGVEWIGDRDRITLIGSSLGGLTAAWIAQQPAVQTQIDHLILLAPAFQFLAHWFPRLGPETVNYWQQEGWLSVYHYGLAAQVPLAYDFVTDAQQYDDSQLNTPIPTLILHGRHDDVIPIQASRDYAVQRPWVQLVELDSDHSLGNVQTEIWASVQAFLGLAVAIE